VATHQVGDDKKRRMVALTLFLILASMGVFGGVAFTPSCDATGSKAPVGPGSNVAAVKINGKAFNLELAIDNPTRVKGLSGRTSIAPDGGMLFVFPRHQIAVQGFVMRDCSIPIDIVFLDPSGRVTAAHKMVPEEPRKPEETDNAYNDRLKRYSSKFASQFAIELAGNTLDSLGVKEGQVIELDLPGLKARAR
jgi:uncharacterized protein